MPKPTTTNLYPPIESKADLIAKIEQLRGDAVATGELLRRLANSNPNLWADADYRPAGT